MDIQERAVTRTQTPVTEQASALSTNSVLRNTYLLLSLSLGFSALTAWLSAKLNAPMMHWAIMLIGFYGLLFAIEKTKNSVMGLVLTFVFTGFLGYTLGPVLALVSAAAPKALMLALGGTAAIFFSLSAYVITTGKDMSRLGGFIFIGFWVLLIAVIANLFLNIPALGLTISALFIFFSSAVILYQTSEIVRGGETNYITATVTLFVSLYNIFVSLLHIILSFAGDE